MMFFEFATKKKLTLPDDTELVHRVTEVEQEMNSPLDVFGDEERHRMFSKIMSLSLEERRLLIVWSILDCSFTRAAKLFKVDVKTVSSRINDIIYRLKDL